MKINILMGAFLPAPPVRGGAVERVQCLLAEGFARAGHQVSIVSRLYGDLPKEEVVNGVAYRRVGSLGRTRWAVVNYLIDAAYSLSASLRMRDADVTVTNTFFAPFLVPRRAGAIYVHVARMPRGQMRYYRRAARLQAVSKAAAAAVERDAPDLVERVRSIPNPLSALYFGDRPPALDGRSREVLYVGRIAREKGLALLVRGFGKAMADLGPEHRGAWTLRIVGPSRATDGGDGEEFLEELRRSAANLSIQLRIDEPVFDLEKLITIYRGSRIFVYPSLAERGETFGVSPLEAMASGCAVIVSALDCFSEFAANGDTALVFDHRGDGAEARLSEAIARLIGDDARAKTLSSRGLSRASEFHPDRIIDEYLRDFQSLARRKLEDA